MIGRFDSETILEMSSKKPKLSLVILFLLIEIEPIFFRYQPKIGIWSNSFFKIKIGESSGICKAKVSNIDWWADATKKRSNFFKLSKPWNITFVLRTIFNKKTIYLAETLPKNKVNLSGSVKVGIARMNITISPKYKKILKINDLKNCIKN